MASRHKPKLSLTAIPPITTINNQSPRVAVNNVVSAPLLPRPTLTSKESADEDLSSIDPNDLFVRFTIPEIRNIQLKLRADADAKQEELRVMVGERYRDLLQASTSIISIAESSRRVMEALAEMREAMTPDEHQRKPRSSSIRGKDDAHLKALQSLSAHLKLLLDAPEHLWRLLEKKQYLQAAWLFLLARVVHRAMVTEDPEEATWQKEGISVLTQFPLVQRQWDTVAQFRPQIAHRATQHLRESRISSESACSTILTLHLLDSLPLTETLSTLLSQRSRTLNTLLSRNLEFRTPSRPGSPIFKTRRKTLETAAAAMTLNPPSTTPRRARSHKDAVRDVRDAVLELLEVILGTMGIARELFQTGEEGLRMSLVERSLEDIQSNTLSDSALTTSTLLSTLPSSTHLLTLPPSILSYKPYIDLTSPSAHVDLSILDKKLSGWFSKAMEGFQGRLKIWFAGLESIREVWGMRRKVLESLQTVQGLDDTEKRTVQSVLDDSVQERMGEVANAALQDLERTLDSTLGSVVRDMKEEMGNTQLDLTPAAFLFSAPPIPSILPMSISVDPTTSPFKQFKDALRQRVDGRTPSLNRVLEEIESKAREIHDNLAVMDEDGQVSHSLQDKIVGKYHQAAHVSSTRLGEILERVMGKELVAPDQEPGHVVNVIVFVGRLCYYLSLSRCVRDLCYRDETADAFKETLNGLHERSINYWRDHAISKALTQCDLMFIPSSPTPTPEEFEWPTQPSSHLINAFLSLVSSLDRLGISRSTLITKGIIDQVLRHFHSAVTQKLSVDSVAWRRMEVQLLWDLTFLCQLSRIPSDVPKEAEDSLSHKVSQLRERLQSNASSPDVFFQLQVHIDHSIDMYLPRSQTLLAPLLTPSTPRKVHMNGNAEIATTTPKMSATALLPFGPPKADQDFRPAVETVKPSTRFGLLLVGSTTMQ